MSEWQPIETAPKGREIIGCSVDEFGTDGPWTIQWHERSKRWRASWADDYVIDNQSDFGTEYKEPSQPSHWCDLVPLPRLTPAPSQSATADSSSTAPAP